ncbi:MAG: transcriptional regulator [Mesorhizobium sp.]|nr:MAG: transcriptional regulator [Mesorhizobium sp.]
MEDVVRSLGFLCLGSRMKRIPRLAAGLACRAQPGVTRSVSLLAELGLVEVSPSDDDQRRRIVCLTLHGQRLVDVAKHDVWPRIENAVADLCADLSGPLLDQLAAIEDGLAAAPLDRRVKKPEGATR